MRNIPCCDTHPHTYLSSRRDGEPPAGVHKAGEIIIYKNGFKLGEQGEWFPISDPKNEAMIDEARSCALLVNFVLFNHSMYCCFHCIVWCMINR